MKHFLILLAAAFSFQFAVVNPSIQLNSNRFSVHAQAHTPAHTSPFGGGPRGRNKPLPTPTPTANSKPIIANSSNEVYICNGKTIGKYHYKKDCRGLNACSHEIKKMNLEEAKKEGYTLCGWED